MLIRRRRPLVFRRARYPLMTPDQKGLLILFILVVCILIVLAKASAYLKQLSGEIALSNASDLIIATVNDTINKNMAAGAYDRDYFINFEKNNAGEISAISANMTHINAFSSQVLRDVIAAADDGKLDISIPVGNLLGFNLTLGKGPKIPVDIIMLTSSHTNFKNELVSSGINQTKHQIILELIVDVDVLVPWETLSTQVVCETLIAETVIVGKVPETYVNLE